MLLRHLCMASSWRICCDSAGWETCSAAAARVKPRCSATAIKFQLFDRSGRYTRLTDAGEIWLEYARRALRDLEEGLNLQHGFKLADLL
jgi:LysR family cyn operon transcriptional activator